MAATDLVVIQLKGPSILQMGKLRPQEKEGYFNGIASRGVPRTRDFVPVQVVSEQGLPSEKDPPWNFSSATRSPQMVGKLFKTIEH